MAPPTPGGSNKPPPEEEEEYFEEDEPSDQNGDPSQDPVADDRELIDIDNLLVNVDAYGNPVDPPANPWLSKYQIGSDRLNGDYLQHATQRLEELVAEFRRTPFIKNSSSVYAVRLQGKLDRLDPLMSQRGNLLHQLGTAQLVEKSVPMSSKQMATANVTKIRTDVRRAECQIQKIASEIQKAIKSKSRATECLPLPDHDSKTRGHYQMEDLRLACPLVTDESTISDLKTTWSKICLFARINALTDEAVKSCLITVLQGKYYKAVERHHDKPLAEVLQILTDSFCGATTSAHAHKKLETFKPYKQETFKSACNRALILANDACRALPSAQIPGRKTLIMENIIYKLLPSGARKAFNYEINRAKDDGIFLDIQAQISIADTIFKSMDIDFEDVSVNNAVLFNETTKDFKQTNYKDKDKQSKGRTIDINTVSSREVRSRNLSQSRKERRDRSLSARRFGSTESRSSSMPRPENSTDTRSPRRDYDHRRSQYKTQSSRQNSPQPIPMKRNTGSTQANRHRQHAQRQGEPDYHYSRDNSAHYSHNSDSPVHRRFPRQFSRNNSYRRNDSRDNSRYQRSSSRSHTPSREYSRQNSQRSQASDDDWIIVRRNKGRNGRRGSIIEQLIKLSNDTILSQTLPIDSEPPKCKGCRKELSDEFVRAGYHFCKKCFTARSSKRPSYRN